jgi:hypothetical protein
MPLSRKTCSPRKLYEQVTKDLRPIYTAINADQAMLELEGAMQVAPAIASRVSSLTIFQRSPQWIGVSDRSGSADTPPLIEGARPTGCRFSPVLGDTRACGVYAVARDQTRPESYQWCYGVTASSYRDAWPGTATEKLLGSGGIGPVAS